MSAVVPLNQLAQRIPIVGNEEWRWVPDYEGLYAVSDQGRVASFHYFNGDPGPRILAGGEHSAGYITFVLHNGEGGRRTWSAHELVLGAFEGPRPDGMVTRHLDGDPKNNTLGNLTYGTYAENVEDSKRHGTWHNSSRTHCPQGHPYDEDNTDHYRGTRRCKTCQSEHSKDQWRQRKQQAREAMGPRSCKECGTGIPASAHLNRRYCSRQCRQIRNERERSAA